MIGFSNKRVSQAELVLVEADDLTASLHGQGYRQMVVERGIPFTFLCEHHFLPFTGRA